MFRATTRRVRTLPTALLALLSAALSGCALARPLAVGMLGGGSPVHGEAGRGLESEAGFSEGRALPVARPAGGQVTSVYRVGPAVAAVPESAMELSTVLGRVAGGLDGPGLQPLHWRGFPLTAPFGPGPSGTWRAWRRAAGSTGLSLNALYLQGGWGTGLDPAAWFSTAWFGGRLGDPATRHATPWLGGRLADPHLGDAFWFFVEVDLLPVHPFEGYPVYLR